jgi:hypothetical protein
VESEDAARSAHTDSLHTVFNHRDLWDADSACMTTVEKKGHAFLDTILARYLPRVNIFLLVYLMMVSIRPKHVHL